MISINEILLIAFSIVCVSGAAALFIYKLGMRKHKKVKASKDDDFTDIQLLINKVCDHETEQVAEKMILWFTDKYGASPESKRLIKQLQTRKIFINAIQPC